jgi:hypothetical protein
LREARIALPGDEMSEPDFGFQKQITDLIDKVEPLLEELRSQGVNSVLLTHTYDQMTDQAFTQWREFGDKTALMGTCQEYMWCKQAQSVWLHDVAEDEE